MRVILQRVTAARVEVDGGVAGSIEHGLLILVGVSKTDTRADADYLAEKTVRLRIFGDETGKMNRDVMESGGALLVVSQFTLYADTRKGRRPGFDLAADPVQAKALYEYFLGALRALGARVETGVFQSHMSIHLTNEGPVTIILDSERRI